MNNRERWTVYPLLFLAIGLAVRAGIADRDPFDALRGARLEADQIFCREIVVTGSDGLPIVHVGRVRDGGGGRIEIRDAKGVDVIGIGTLPGDRNGGIDFFDADGRPLQRLAAPPGE
ncbi:MAG: hypothetical protein ACK5SI_00460 [Planctomycetia bacterium]|jgi:hypothetical protein